MSSPFLLWTDLLELSMQTFSLRCLYRFWSDSIGIYDKYFEMDWDQQQMCTWLIIRAEVSSLHFRDPCVAPPPATYCKCSRYACSTLMYIYVCRLAVDHKYVLLSFTFIHTMRVYECTYLVIWILLCRCIHTRLCVYVDRHICLWAYVFVWVPVQNACVTPCVCIA